MWNFFRKEIKRNYAIYMDGEFDTYYKGKKMKATCLKFNFRLAEPMGLCALKYLLGKRVRGTTLWHVVDKDKDLSSACRSLLNRVMISTHVYEQIPAVNQTTQITDVQRGNTTHQSGETTAVEENNETVGKFEANEPQNTQGPQGTKEIKVAHGAQEQKETKKSEKTRKETEKENSDPDYYYDDEDEIRDSGNYDSEYGDGYDSDDYDGADEDGYLQESERSLYNRPIRAELIIFVDLRSLRCNPPADLSLCSQYVSLKLIYLLLLLPVLTF